jgi:hypothetical protein
VGPRQAVFAGVVWFWVSEGERGVVGCVGLRLTRDFKTVGSERCYSPPVPLAAAWEVLEEQAAGGGVENLSETWSSDPAVCAGACLHCVKKPRSLDGHDDSTGTAPSRKWGQTGRWPSRWAP